MYSQKQGCNISRLTWAEMIKTSIECKVPNQWNFKIVVPSNVAKYSAGYRFPKAFQTFTISSLGREGETR